MVVGRLFICASVKALLVLSLGTVLFNAFPSVRSKPRTTIWSLFRGNDSKQDILSFIPNTTAGTFPQSHYTERHASKTSQNKVELWE